MLEVFASPWAFGSVLSVSVLLGFIIYKVGSFKFSKGEFSAGQNTKIKVSPHSTCPHAKDIMEVIHRTLEYSEKRQELSTRLLDDQMRFYEETEEEILGTFKKIFLSVLADKLVDVDSYVQHPEYTAYMITLKAVAADIKSYIRTCFKSNHYSGKSPEDQRNYIDKKKSVIIQKVTEALNMYWRGTTITRSDIYKANRDNIKDFEVYIEDIFNRAFTIARDTNDELERMESSYKQYIEFTVGTNF